MVMNMLTGVELSETARMEGVTLIGTGFSWSDFDIRPILDLNMRLGEGTGAALAMLLVEGAVKVYNDMATFSSAGVSDRA